MKHPTPSTCTAQRGVSGKVRCRWSRAGQISLRGLRGAGVGWRFRPTDMGSVLTPSRRLCQVGLMPMLEAAAILSSSLVVPPAGFREVRPDLDVLIGYVASAGSELQTEVSLPTTPLVSFH